MSKKLEKTVITIDGVLQSPIASSNKVYTLDKAVDFEETTMVLTGIGTIRVGDLLLIEDEFVVIDNVGLGTTAAGPINNSGDVPLLEVKRGTVGSAATDHALGTPMELYRGSYNLVGSDIIFTEAPSGKGSFSINESNLVEFNSDFQGRTFLQKEYDQIVVLDDISDQFDGETSSFTLTSAGSTTNEIENGSGLLLINDIYQTPTTANNEGNNYFYTFNPVTGINSVNFTGISSANGDQILSEFDVNQNEVPRGGLVVSLGSTPGLGYAPVYGASIEAVVNGSGAITGILTENQIGVTTDIIYADYNNVNGEMVVSALGAPLTGPISIGVATYQNISGQLLIESTVSLSSIDLQEKDIVVLDGLEFDCAGLSTTTLEVRDAPYDYISGIVTITTLNNHNSEIGDNIQLRGLEYKCDSSITERLEIIDAPYDNATGIVTVSTSTPHTLLNGDKVLLLGLEYECNGTSLETFNVTNVIYDAATGISTVTLDGSHNTDPGARIQLSGIEFDCGDTSLITLDVTNAPYDSASGLATVTFLGNHFSEVGDRVQLSGLEYECNGTSLVAYNVIDAPYSSTTGIATIQLDAPHNQIAGSRVILDGLEYDCNGTSLTTLNIFNVRYDEVTGVSTITFLANHNTEVGDRVQLSGIEFTCPGSVRTSGINNAVYNNETGDLEIFLSAAETVPSLGENVRLRNLRFECAVDSGFEVYPKFPEKDIPIQQVTGANSFIVNVGVSTRNSNIIAADFDPYTGITTFTIDNSDPSLVAGETVELTAAFSGPNYTGSDGRFEMLSIPSTDSFTVGFSSTVDETSVEMAVYDKTVGIVTLMTNPDRVNNISVGSSVIISELQWRCTQDFGGTTGIVTGTSTYPAVPTVFEVLSVSGAGNTTFTIQAGVSTIDHEYRFDGKVVFGIDAPTFVSGDATLGFEENNYVVNPTAQVRIGFTTNIYPDGTYGYEFDVIDVPSNNSLVVNVGTSTITHNYVNGSGIATVGFTTTVYPDGANGYEFEIVNVPSADTLEVNVGTLPGVEHTYVTGGIATVGLTTTFFPDGTNGYEFDIVDIVSSNVLVVNVGAIPGIEHTYVGGGIGTVGFTTSFFPDGTNGYEFEILETPSLNTVVINTGDSPYPHTYIAGGIGTVGLTTNIFPDGTNGFEFNVSNVIDPTTFVVNVGAIPGIEHNYVGSGTAFVGFTTTIFPDGTNGYEFEVLDVLGGNVLAVNVGPSPFAHEYVGGGEMTVGFNTSIFPIKTQSSLLSLSSTIVSSPSMLVLSSKSHTPTSAVVPIRSMLHSSLVLKSSHPTSYT